MKTLPALTIVSAILIFNYSATLAGSEDVRTGRYYYPPSMGEQTRAWLDMQRGGEHATAYEHSLPPRIQDRVYERYLNSFEHPIPENFFDTERFRDMR